MSFNTPIVLVIFKRPELTKKVLDQVSRLKPSRLFVIADGPRENDLEEHKLCQEAREIIREIDWDCEIFWDLAENNLGCRRRISSGLYWVFSHVEEAIILEDDCVPCLDFFRFSSSLLNYYRDDERVWVISGNNFQDGKWHGDGSYYFSRYNHCWGWATWRRAWQHFRDELDDWPKLRDSKLLASILPDPIELEYWSDIFERLYVENKPDSWAYRWTYTCWANNALSILPNVNLVTNIGFGEESTHTKNINSPLANLPTQKMQKLVHPSFVLRNEAADQYTFDHAFGGIEIRQSKKMSSRIKRRIKQVLLYS